MKRERASESVGRAAAGRWVRGLLLAALAASSGCAGGSRDAEPGGGPGLAGLLVVEVAPGYAAARAGVAAGDRLEAWSRRDGGGEVGERSRLASVEELRRVEVEEGALGRVTLHGRRGGRRLAVEVAGGEWRLEAQPDPEPRASAAAPAGTSVVAPAGSDTSAPLAAWASVLRAESRMRAQRPGEAHAELLRALAGVPEAGALRAHLLELAAVASYRETRPDDAEREATEALALWRAVAPHGPGVARCRILLGKIARNRSRFEAAAEHLDRALEAAEADDPGGPLTALALTERANLADYRGDLDGAEADLARALALYGALGVGDATAGSAAMTHGILAFRRGDFGLAEERMRRALELFRSEAPAGALAAWALNGLGLLARERGDYPRAADLLGRSLAIRERMTPDSLDVGICHENLGLVAASRGDLATAVAELGRAVALFEAKLPGSSSLARILAERGSYHREGGDLDAAETDLERALAIQARLVPGSLEHAEGLFALAELERQRGRRERARALHERALALRARLAPGSLDEARSLHALGLLERGEGRRVEALDLLRRAATALEAQHERVGGDREDRSLFAARVAPLYRDLIELAVEDGAAEAALLALERYHAQALRSLLATRVLALDRELPAPLARRRRELARDYERERAQLARLGLAGDAAEVERRLARLRELADERRGLEREAATLAPRRAALRPAGPPSLAALRGGIEPGALVLAFSVHASRTYRFAWDGQSAAPGVESIPLGAAELAREVEAIRDLAASPDAPPTARRALATRARSLGEALLGSVADRIVAAGRLVVIPDGPLHALPLGVLRLVDAAGAERNLIEVAALSAAPSLAVRAALAGAAPGASAKAPLVAFGDPRPAARESGANAAEAAPLPGGEREVAALARLYAGARTFVGAAATEERVRVEAVDAALLHFACHARTDDRFPLDSHLVLAAPRDPRAGENGLLAAWEIFEQMRLGADLVALSACETGLGAERAGEGLVGLTSAFQYAGARAVLSSLWTVSDFSTAALMERFYARLARGLPADEALRAAQLDLLRGPVRPPPAPASGLERWRLDAIARLRGAAPGDSPRDARHPFHWAAYQLNGAPR